MSPPEPLTFENRIEARTGIPAPGRLLAGWHLGSLDAPTVAAVWTWFVARCSGIILPWTDPAAMFAAVWLLYAADRLLDARALSIGQADGLEARHRFHHRHGFWFRFGIVVSALVLASLLPYLGRKEMRLYLVLGSLLASWFVLIHSARLIAIRPLPKELAIGVFFAAAILVPTLARVPGSARSLLMPAALFGALCSLNSVCIFAWESMGRRDPAGHRSTVLAAARVLWLACGLALAGAGTALLLKNQSRWLCVAVALSSLLLLLLHLTRNSIERTTLRALADLVLLTPLLILPWMP